MSYNSLTRFERPLRLELGASPLLARVAAAVHLLAGAACLLASLPGALRWALAAASALHYGWFVRRQCRATTSRAVSGIAWDRQRGWTVRCGESGWRGAQLLSPVFVSLPLVILRFRVSGGARCSALVVADRLDAEGFRRLRLRVLQSLQMTRN